MLETAINKISAEIDANASNAYVKYIGEYLIDYLRKTPEHAAKVAHDKKSVFGSLTHMKSVASKKQANGVAVLTPEEGFKAVLEYYAIDEQVFTKTENTPKKIDISLDDLF
jgi:hypothetical protein